MSTSRLSRSRSTRLQAAWFSSPLVSFFLHRSRLGLFRQLDAFLNAGVSLSTALSELSHAAPSAALRAGLVRVADDVSRGGTLAAAMEAHVPQLGMESIELVRVAEELGVVEQALARVVARLEETQRVRRRIVLGSLWLSFTLVGAVVLEPLLSAIAGMNGKLDGLGRRYVLGLIRNVIVFGGTGGLLVGLPFIAAWFDIEATVRGWVQRIPLLGELGRQQRRAQFAWAWGAALAAGAEMGRALRIAAQSTRDALMMTRAEDVVSALQHGSTLTEAVRASALLDRHGELELRVGETSGTLDRALAQMSKRLDERAATTAMAITIVGITVVALAAVALVLKGLFAVIFGPIKSFYDNVGNGGEVR